MLAWVVPLWLVTLLLGLWPSRAIGSGVVAAKLVAGAVVLLVMVASGALCVRAARRGPGPAAFAFTVLAMARVLVSLSLLAGAWALLELPPAALLIWAVIFHLVMLVGECIWLARALQRDAFLVALGEIRRGAVLDKPRPSPGRGEVEIDRVRNDVAG
jgi:hypothetical protein